MSECPVCEYKNIVVSGPADYSRYKIECHRCGTFCMDEDTASDLPSLIKSNEHRLLLSHKIRRSQIKNKIPNWDYELCEKIIKNHSLPNAFEQTDALLELIGQQSPHPGARIAIQIAPSSAYTGAWNAEGLMFCATSLQSLGLIDFGAVSGGEILGRAKLTLAGWERYNTLIKGGMTYNKAFMAMKFGDEVLDSIVNNFFKTAVRETGFELLKLDDRPEAGLIDIRLRQEIKTSSFIIADLTHNNLGAYWEAGFAEGIGKKVIYTCEKSKFEEAKTHFDVNHHLTIIWDTKKPQEAADSLKAAIRYTFPEAKQAD